MSAQRACRRRARIKEGRRILLAVIVVLLANEFLGLLISGFTLGGYSLLQLASLVAVAAGAIYAFHHGSKAAYWVLAIVPGAFGVYQVSHLWRFPHALNVQSVIAASQSCIRLGSATVLAISRTAKEYREDVASAKRRRQTG